MVQSSTALGKFVDTIKEEDDESSHDNNAYSDKRFFDSKSDQKLTNFKGFESMSGAQISNWTKKLREKKKKLLIKEEKRES